MTLYNTYSKHEKYLEFKMSLARDKRQPGREKSRFIYPLNRKKNSFIITYLYRRVHFQYDIKRLVGGSKRLF